MGVWAWALDPQLAAPLVVWGSLVGQVLTIRTVRGGFSWHRAMPFVVGGVVGVPMGAWLLAYVDMHMFKIGVGALLLLYCSALLLIRQGPKMDRAGPIVDGAVGMVGGVMGGLGGLTGPAPTLWCTLKGWDKDTQRAVFQTFSLCMQSLTLAIYVGKGTVTGAMMPLFALMVPVAIIPTLAGAWLYRRFSDVAFRKLVLVLLSITGAVLLLSSLRG
jgi:hypothetical protein